MGNLVGMAFVVARPHGRYEIRESVHTAAGPRARTLANFAALTPKVLEAARRRATRPFDAAKVLASAARRGVQLAPADGPTAAGPTAAVTSAAGFVAASRRFARRAERPAPQRRLDPGASLIELLAFAEEVARHRPPRPVEPLAFPPLAQLAAVAPSR